MAEDRAQFGNDGADLICGMPPDDPFIGVMVGTLNMGYRLLVVGLGLDHVQVQYAAVFIMIKPDQIRALISGDAAAPDSGCRHRYCRPAQGHD